MPTKVVTSMDPDIRDEDSLVVSDHQVDAPVFTTSGPRRSGLGRGLGALIPAARPNEIGDGRGSREIEIGAIEPNPYQPRTTMDRGGLEELATSIRIHGVIQPLIVTTAAVEGRYVLVAGERRWRAAGLAGLDRVPVIIKNTVPRVMLELALVENIVRSDLSPLEEAAAYRQLIDEFGLTQAKVAERVGRSRVSITNTLRLLSAPEPVQASLAAGLITEGHARALIGLSMSMDQISALNIVVEKRLSVRQAEDLVRRWTMGSKRNRPAGEPDAEQRRIEDRFRAALGTKVTVKPNASGTGGTLSIQYFSDEALAALYERLVGEEDW
ncbi:MAG: ParB/RepB/Spo0J family partition protein [Chloroflexota bacterium]|nr:ParB/RepB/Spo0J family partition protein [Chloroflexota bacterium]